MSYINENKKAWEKAFDHRSGHYSEDLIEKLKEHKQPFFHQDFFDIISSHNLKEKTIGQFCTNNGRELLQLSTMGVDKAIGFDLAQNMVDYANDIASTLNLPAKFIQTNILEIDRMYNSYFDYGLITVGAMCWFKDLNTFFKKVTDTLKPSATLFIHESHPFELMLATPYEDDYIESYPKALVYDYFSKKVWEEHGMGYMSEEKLENTFTSFSHSLSDVFTALINNGFEIILFKEFDYCIGNILNHLDHQGIPLSMAIVATKK